MRDVWKKRILSLALTAAMVLGAGAPALGGGDSGSGDHHSLHQLTCTAE